MDKTLDGKRKCRACRKGVEIEATRCEHCGETYTSEEVAAFRASNRKDTRNGIGCLAVLALLVVGYCSLPTTPTDPDSQRKALLSTVSRLAAAQGPCDAAAARTATTLTMMAAGNATAADAYRAVSGAKADCDRAATAVAGISTPGAITGDNSTLLTEALEHCYSGAIARSSSMEQALIAVDGDARPSVAAKFSDEIGRATIQTAMCVNKIALAARALKLSEKDLQAAYNSPAAPTGSSR